MDDWHELSQKATYPAKLPIAVEPTALAFDTKQDIIWVGTKQGRVTGFVGPGLTSYTSWFAHVDEVRDILVHDRGVISLGSRNVRVTHRRGLQRWDIKHTFAVAVTDCRGNGIENLLCMAYSGTSHSEVVAAGGQNNILLLNIDRGTIVKQEPTSEWYTKLRRGRVIAGATLNGNIAIIDPRIGLGAQNKVEGAHTGGIEDIDTQDNTLLSCGWTFRPTGYVLDPLVKRWDIRNLRSLVPIPSFAPSSIRMHPKFTNTGVISQRSGQFNFVDVDNTALNHLYHATMPSETAVLTRMAISPSGEALALADNEGILHVWGRGSNHSAVQFTEYPAPIEWPHAPQENLPTIDINDPEIPLSTVGMPYYSTELLSAWPSHMVFDVGNPPPQINEKTLKGMTKQDWYLYGRWNQNARRRYQVDKPERVEELPRFRSQVEKERARAGEEETLEKVVGRFEGGEGGVPNYYKEVEIKYSKFGVEDFDFGFYNPTPFSGLETHIANSYANSLLQVYHFTPSIRLYALAHTATTCRISLCALCELGFLFQNLIDAKGQNCQSTNFSRYLGSTLRTGGHDIVEDDLFHKESESKVSKTIRLNRFLTNEGFFDNHGKGHHNHGPAHSQDRNLRGGRLWMDVIRLFRCNTCGHEHSDKHREYMIEMVYHKTPSALSRRDRDRNIPSFGAILKSSIHRDGEQQTMFCNSCRARTIATVRKTVQNFSSVLNINTNVTEDSEWRYWGTPGWLPSRLGMSTHNGRLSIFQGKDLEKKRQEERVNSEYELCGMVLEIKTEKEDPHLVAIVKIPKEEVPPEATSPWYLFNDFLVRNISEDEALSFPGIWKWPSVIMYKKILSERRTTSLSQSIRSIQQDPWLLFNDFSLTQFHPNGPRDPRKIQHRLLGQADLPLAKKLFAIDAEFVLLQNEEAEITSTGERELLRPKRHGLGRVSLLRGWGSDMFVPFIDDYIAAGEGKENIVDYLTAFSGLVEGDLNPRTSQRTLVPLKIAYKKLRLLVNLGAIFVGHGLASDFRTMNLIVPKEQVIDTYELFWLRSKGRRLSLKFLAWYLLNQSVQVATHDSIEDARTALLLYQKYLELKQAGTLQETLKDIYEKGSALGFRPPQALEIPVSPTKSEFEGAREVPVNVPGSVTPMRIMMRGGDVRGVANVQPRPLTADGNGKGTRNANSLQDV